MANTCSNSVSLQVATRHRRSMARFGLCVITSAILPATALAIDVPSSVEPSRIMPLMQGPHEPSLNAPGEALPIFPSDVERPPNPTNEVVRFVLNAVSIEGATVYTQADFKPFYADSLGKIVPLAEAQTIANQITARYRRDGYVLSQAVVPRQDLRDGTLHIRVVEGFVDQVLFDGNSQGGDTRGLARQYAEKITQERPLRIQTLERYLLLLNDLPGVTAHSVLHPSPDTFGAANLLVTFTRKGVDATIAADNRLSRYLGSLEQSATFGVNSLAGLDERTQLQASSADPARAMHMVALQHQELLGSEGTSLLLNASQTRTQPGLTLAPLQLEALSKDIQATLQHPFIRQRAENLTGRAVLDYRNTDTTVFGTTTLTSDRVRALRLGGNYAFADAMQGTDLLDVQASRGLNLLNATATGDLRTQPHAPGDFTKLNFDASRIQLLPRRFSLYTAFSGQIAADPLLAAEQFALGGPAYGSAFDPGTLAGDQGAAARAELRYAGEFSGRYPLTWQVYSFYDVGSVWDNTKTPGKSSLASAGLGTRFGVATHLSGIVELAIPITKKVSLINEDYSPRVFFGLQSAF